MKMEDKIRKRMALDPEIQEIQEFITSDLGRAIAVAGGVSLESLDRSIETVDSTIRNLANSIECLGALGWATNSGGAPLDEQREALGLVTKGAIDEANAILSTGWEKLADRVVGQVAGLHFGDDSLWEIATARWALVAKAMAHHFNGDYEASILLLLTQVEGIVMDVTVSSNQPMGKYFFKTKRGASATDGDTVVGIEGALSIVRDWFCGGVLETQIGGTLSRHGIAHGRQLGYGTRENSARCIALLAAVIEWVRPLAEQLADQRNNDRLAVHAGSEEVDDSGIRMDRRGFSDARSRLLLLRAAQEQFRDAYGHFASGAKRTRFKVKGAELVTEMSKGGHWSGYTASESGLIFGLAVSDTGLRYFEGKSVPPRPESTDWSDEETPNWSGEVY
jgi:hypothetical protein